RKRNNRGIGDIHGGAGTRPASPFFSPPGIPPIHAHGGRFYKEVPGAFEGSPLLTVEEKSVLGRIARETVHAWVREGRKPDYEALPPKLTEPSGAFVTLRAGGTLRGCLGLVEGVRPLWVAVRDMAANAATSDPRFDPVDPGELEGLEVEVSALSPLIPMEDVEDIQVGVHGLMIRKGGRSGLLLPQVATEHGWDRETFLDQTCWKAGISPGSWKEPGCEILSFTAEVFQA
ncbi:MAG: AmmeMemoRadiSam system protein A, partial [Planctomycetota bacterium]